MDDEEKCEDHRACDKDSTINKKEKKETSLVEAKHLKTQQTHLNSFLFFQISTRKIPFTDILKGTFTLLAPSGALVVIMV